MKKENEVVEAEVLDDFKAPALRDATELVKLVNVDSLLQEYSEIPDIDPESEEASVQYQHVRKGHLAFVSARTGIEKLRKEITDPALRFQKKCIEIEKEVVNKLAATEQKLYLARKVVEDHEKRKIEEAEEAERVRVESTKSKITDIDRLPVANMHASSASIKSAIELLAVPGEEFEEFIDDAMAAYSRAMLSLEQLFETKVKAENADRLEAERQAREAKERAEREAEEKAKREAFEAEQRAFREKQEAADRAARAQQEEINRQRAEFEAEQLAARQKAEREEREKQEAADRAAREAEEKKAKAAKEKADKKLYEKRYGEALEDMAKEVIEAPASVTTAGAILDAVLSGKIRHVKWAPNEQ